MLAMGALALLYVLFAASSKPRLDGGFARFADGEMRALTVLEDPPPLPSAPLYRAGAPEPQTLDALETPVLVLNLWATWCAPCREEMPTLAELDRRFEGRGLDVVAVSVDSLAMRAEAEALLATLGGGALEFWNDPTRGVLFDLRAAGMPVTVIYVRGREVARLTGGADWASPEAVALMEAALSEDR